MSVSPNTQAILLLTSHFSKPKKDGIKPLTPKEWGRFALWLKDKDLTPDQLLLGSIGHHLEGWSDKTVSIQRIQALLDRGSALALAIEKWLRSGLWVMTRSDADYPHRLKKRLATDSPAILFGCGNRGLLNGGGLAVVGSRNTSEADLAYSRNLGELAATCGYSVVSGGARGVDENAMLGALNAEGTVVGVLADSLQRASTSKKYRNFLMNNNLALVSSFYPDAGFNVGNAMQRNKYIYCLSDAAVVVHSGTKGGTWNGSKENLKNHWVPLWVKTTEDDAAGNSAIVEEGASWISSNLKCINFSTLFTLSTYDKIIEDDLQINSRNSFAKETTDLLSQPSSESPQTYVNEPDLTPDVEPAFNTVEDKLSENNRQEYSIDGKGFYEFFLIKAKSILKDTPKTAEELAVVLELNKTQTNAWLKKAVVEKKIQKLSKPVRYEWNNARQVSLELLFVKKSNQP
jgi:predicted Rossmann fold nucleotide-binding protein DprA/Smf involved in DNA uptake